MNFLMISYNDYADKLSTDFLDNVASPTYPLGKKTEKGWIFKSDGVINDDNKNVQINNFNAMCWEARTKGYVGVIITKNPPVREGNLQTASE